MKDLTKLTDAQLTAKNKQIGRILQAYPHRDGVNYGSGIADGVAFCVTSA